MLLLSLSLLFLYFTHSFISCHIAINYVCYLLLLHKAKVNIYTTTIFLLTISKMKSNKFKQVDIKNCTCYYFDYIITSREFDLDNILLVEKSHETMSIYNVA